jgi:hypothetical protein
MAGCYTFSCDHCGFSVDSWEDGNRYLEWPIGTRNYLYHPSDIDETERLMREIYGHSPTPDEYMTAFRRYGGNETEFLCCGCLAISRIDEKRDLRVCSSCKSAALREIGNRLAATECPKCRQGHFDAGKMTGVS